jgi:hypothetical protein
VSAITLLDAHRPRRSTLVVAVAVAAGLSLLGLVGVVGPVTVPGSRAGAQTAGTLEPSLTCVLVGQPTPITLWGAGWGGGPDPVTIAPTGNDPVTVVPTPALGTPANGSFTTTVSVTAPAVGSFAFLAQASGAAPASATTAPIYAVDPASGGPGCPTPSTPTPCVQATPLTTTVAISVTGLVDLAAEGAPPLQNWFAVFFFDYHEPDPPPANPPQAVVTNGSVSRNLIVSAPATPPYPNAYLLTVRIDPPPSAAAPAGSRSQYVSLALPPCASHTTTTSTAAPPASVGPTVATTAPLTPPVPNPVPLPTSSPVLRLSPGVGPDGFVTAVTGSGFPAGAAVSLFWSPGLGVQVVHAGADGTFHAGVLVLPRDVEGRRSLRAVGFPSASAPFLVVAGSAGPPRSGGEWVFRG